MADSIPCQVSFCNYSGTSGWFLGIVVGGTYSIEIKPTNNNWQNPYVSSVVNQNLANKEDKSNKVTSLSASSTDTQYPSAKCVYDIVGNIESLLGGI